MRALPFLITIALALPTVVFGETWRNSGEHPNWPLWFDEAQGEFTFPSPAAMDVVQRNAAENRHWTRALTLICVRDTAIVLVEPLAFWLEGKDDPTHALGLTQRGQTPILLTGCCGTPE